MSLLSGEVGLKFPQRVMTKIYKKAYILVPLSLANFQGPSFFPFLPKMQKNKRFILKVFILSIKKNLKSLIFNLPIKWLFIVFFFREPVILKKVCLTRVLLETIKKCKGGKAPKKFKKEGFFIFFQGPVTFSSKNF